MKTMIVTLFILMFVPVSKAQQWSKDPVADHLLQLQADIMKAQEVLNYCEQTTHRQEKMCDGINDGTPSKWMEYKEAEALGQKQLDQEKEQKIAPSLGEIARQMRLKHQALEAEVEQVVNDYCSKHSDNTSKLACSDKHFLIQSVVARREANSETSTRQPDVR